MIIQADILDWARSYDGPLFHALLCDPPYHLTEPAYRNTKWTPDTRTPHGRAKAGARGFMNARWDGVDEHGRAIAFEPETWATIARVLHPGAFGMAFASTRGWHRMAVAIEDAGLIIHPVIMAWSFGSGFPKATRISNQVDDQWARAWAGHRYGGQTLKPALEPIIVFQKPYQGRPVDSITRTGAGALWIDGGRIEWDEKSLANDTRRRQSPGTDITSGRYIGGENGAYDRLPDSPAGRWPANLILSHSPDCNGMCVPACPVRRLGEQSGELTSGYMQPGQPRYSDGGYHGDFPDTCTETGTYGDSGTAARFFYQSDWMAERLEDADPLIYEAKASTAEREAGLERFAPTTVDDGRQKSIDNAYQRGETTRRNIHPTVKPISLARHLATLLLPPDLYAPRRLLVPFAGVASEMIGAMLAGWEEVIGVELEAEHIPIAQARLDYWQQRKWELANPARDITIKRAADAPDGQLDMFESEVA